MQFGKYQQRMEYLLELIRKERTGTPRQLACRLGISERMLYRYIGELDALGHPVAFCRKKNSYKFRSLT